jgi:di/tricarboxylate transporter
MDATIYTFVILVATISLFVWNKLRADLVAVISLIALFLGGVLSPSQALSGFGDSTVIMIAALFVVGEGLSRTGVTTWISRYIITLAGQNPMRVIVVLMAGTAFLSAFMSNTGTVATLLPAVVAIAWSIDSLPSKLLIPLAFAANAGGLLTLTGTPPNIVVSDTLANAGLEPFGYFEYSLIGIPLLVVTIGYMALFGWKLLPSRQSGDRPEDLDASMHNISTSFDLKGKLFLAYINPGSVLEGKSLAESALGKDYMVTVLRIDDSSPLSGQSGNWHQNYHQRIDRLRSQKVPGPTTRLRSHTILTIKGSSTAIKRAAEALQFEIEEIDLDNVNLSNLLVGPDIGLAEVLLTPRSRYRGLSVKESNFVRKYRVQVMSISRGENLITRKDTKLQFGDALLVRGYWDDIEHLRQERRNFTVIGSPDELSRQVSTLNYRSLIAILAMVGMVALMVFKVLPTVMAVLIAAVVMVLGGCLNMNQGYRSIGWQSVVLIAAMIPMSTALEVTGGAKLIADNMVATIGAIGPLALLTGVFLLTAGFSQVLSNTATTVLMAPIVLQASAASNISPYPMMMMVAIGASAAFLTPISSTTNLMVMTPGGYSFMDYARIGLPLMILFLVVSLVLVPLIWPL